MAKFKYSKCVFDLVPTCNDINKDRILPPSNVVVVVAEQHTDVNKGVCYFVIYNSFEHGSANQNQGPEISAIISFQQDWS